MLADLPQPLGQTDYFQASVAAKAEQLDDLDASLTRLEGLMTIAGAQDADLPLWEAQEGVSPVAGSTSAQRRQVLTAFRGRMLMTGMGSEWEELASQILGTLGAAWTYVHTPGTRTVAVSLSSSTLTTSYAATLLRSITPANTLLTVGTAAGFQWDGSLWDEDVWH